MMNPFYHRIEKIEKSCFCSKYYTRGEKRMEVMEKPVYVDVNEVSADGGVCRSKGYVISKTDKGNRVIELPEFLCSELEDYVGMIYKIDEHTRLFNITKSYLHYEMDRGSKATGVKRIRIHDLRHSVCAALIDERITLSGFMRSEYFINSCFEQEIYVTGNIRSFV